MSIELHCGIFLDVSSNMDTLGVIVYDCNNPTLSIHPIGSSLINACIMVETDGTLWGYKYNTFGSIDPTETADGTLTYQYTTDDSGNLELRFGTTGTTKLVDVDEIYVEDKYFKETLVFIWDDVAKGYLVTDAEYGQKIRDEFTNVGTFEMCIGVYVLPDEFIRYNYSEIEIGDAP
jgi:hypothetical protein